MPFAPRPAHRPARLHASLFAIPFGLEGVSGCWLVAAGHGLAPVAVGGAVSAVAVAAWVAVLSSPTSADCARWGPALRADLSDRTLGPFLPLIVLAPMMIAAQGVHPLFPATGRALVDVFLVLALLLGAWFIGDWI